MNQANPWEAFHTNHHRQERITSTVSRIVADIGLFVALDGGIDGIVHLSDLDWTIPGEKAIAKYHVGDLVDVVVLTIQPEMERVCLGIKQLGPDPRPDRRDEPPAPVPVTPNGPKSPKPQSAAANNE